MTEQQFVEAVGFSSVLPGSDALQLAMQYTQSGYVFNISDCEPVDFRAFMSQRLKVSGFPVPTLSVPRTLAWWLGAFTETGWKYLPMPGSILVFVASPPLCL